MGTRSITAYCHGGIVRAQYLQFDGGITSHGKDCMELLLKMLPYAFAATGSERECRMLRMLEAHLDLLRVESCHSWDYRWEATREEFLTLDTWIGANAQFVRLIDLDEGTVTFFEAGPEQIILQWKLEDVVRLACPTMDRHIFLGEFFSALRKAWESCGTWPGLRLEIGINKARMAGQAPGAREFCVVRLGDDPVFASFYAPAEMKKKACDWSKSLVAA